MAEKNDGGDKTEKPTAKKLQDARKKGDVPKSKDVTATVVLIAWLGLGSLLWRFVLERFARPFELVFASISDPSPHALQAVAMACGQTFMMVTLALFATVAAVGALTDFLQAGPVLTTEKLQFKLDHLNPGEGLKRMVAVDNLFEVGKSLAKTALLILITWIVLTGAFSDLMRLPLGDAGSVATALGGTLFQLTAVTAVVFLLVATLDATYQRFSFNKKMRMSHRDIRQESKDAEGDPHLRAHRRQLHQEWASRNAVEQTRGAAALVVNPTHIAVALAYDPALHPAPVVASKGEGPLAALMRAAAEDAEVPIIRNVELARALNLRGNIDDIVPEDMFAAVAEVIIWARRVREDAKRQAAEAGATPASQGSEARA